MARLLRLATGDSRGKDEDDLLSPLRLTATIRWHRSTAMSGQLGIIPVSGMIVKHGAACSRWMFHDQSSNAGVQSCQCTCRFRAACMVVMS